MDGALYGGEEALIVIETGKVYAGHSRDVVAREALIEPARRPPGGLLYRHVISQTRSRCRAQS